MSENIEISVIARIRNDFTAKFGVPRQSGLAESVISRIVFEPEYRSPDAIRGLESFSHLWLIWGFSESRRKAWSPTVRPPRLGGNSRMGVFATRSPFRPNPIALSSVGIVSVEPATPDGPVITVSGADLMDGTPIYDIKPYLPYTDCHPDASGGYTDALPSLGLDVDFPPDILCRLPEDKRAAALEVLSHDPRPSYQNDPEREYGMSFAGFDIRFRVDGGVLRVFEIKDEK